jgi:hypothetical protein
MSAVDQSRPYESAARCGGNTRDGIGGAGAPVDLAPPGENARQVGQDGGDRHDRHGLLRSVLIDQNRHQHDRRAGADDAADGAGEKPDREDEEEIQGTWSILNLSILVSNKCKALINVCAMVRSVSL